MGLKVKTTVLTKKGNWFDVMLPAKRIVCPRCEGAGTQLRGSLSSYVFSADEIHARCNDLAQAYARGDYDTVCEECNGANVVSVVDEDALTYLGLDKMRERYERAKDKARESELESYYEQRLFSRAGGE